MDDDIYLNPHQLLNYLRGHDHRNDWYLGKPSLGHPLEIDDRNHPGVSHISEKNSTNKRYIFTQVY